MSHISTINMLIEPYKILPPSLKESISRVVLNQSFQTLTEFIGKSIQIYDILQYIFIICSFHVIDVVILLYKVGQTLKSLTDTDSRN
jgi:hypothetical protein